MKKMVLKAPAKLNLILQVLSERKDGYHEIRGVNCSLNLADTIILTKQPKKIEIICSNKEVPEEDKNLSYQTAKKLKKMVGRADLGVRIEIIKNIPIKAGLGGGSSDAAATLKGLNKLWELNLKAKQLNIIGQKIGTDICYCLIGGVCQISGTGEKVKKLDLKLPKIPIVIVSSETSKPSTAWAYKNLDLSFGGRDAGKTERLIKAIKAKDIQAMAENLENDFEPLMDKSYPIIRKIKEEMIKYGALRAMLAGSGLAVFGLFKNENTAENAHLKLKKKYQKVYLTKAL